MPPSQIDVPSAAHIVPHAPDCAAPAAVTLHGVAALVGAPVLSQPDPTVTGVSDDSRTVEAGELYLALPSTRAHGRCFEAQARARGAVAMVSDRPGAVLPTVVVDDPRLLAGPISAHVHHHPSHAMALYGVTGTNGKTSTTDLLGAALTAAGERVGTITGIAVSSPTERLPATRTTPEAAALQRILAGFRRDRVTAAAMEVSSHAVTQHRIAGIRFAVMGFTNLGIDHLDFHGTMEQYFQAKAAMFVPERTATAAIGIDDDYGRRLAGSVAGMACRTFSVTDPSADVHAHSIECNSTGTTFTARTPQGEIDIALGLLGPHQVSNALAALTMLLVQETESEVDLRAAAAGLETVTAVPGRLERIDAGQPFLALVDYMHNTAGQRRLLPYLRTLTSGRVIVVVGATGDRDPGKRFPLGATAAALTDIVIVTDESPYSENPAVIREAVTTGACAARGAEVIVEPDRRRAFACAVAYAEPGDVVVVTGRGCDTRQVFGDSVCYFDDRTELRSALTSRTPDGPPDGGVVRSPVEK